MYICHIYAIYICVCVCMNSYVILSGQLKGFPRVILIIYNFYMSYEIQLHYYVLDAFHTLSHLTFVSIHFTEEQFKSRGV